MIGRKLAEVSGFWNWVLWHLLPWRVQDLLRKWTGKCFVMRWDPETENVECRWVLYCGESE